jgi:ADP-dependent phosphofructokinase/glucokinase
MITPDNLTELKNLLPRGYFPIVVSKVPFSERTVANLFSGKIYKPEIHQACLDVLEEEKQRLQSVTARHKSTLGHE